MKSRITSLGLPAALLSVSLFAACQNTARGVEQDTERNTAEARRSERRSRREAGSARSQRRNEAGSA